MQRQIREEGAHSHHPSLFSRASLWYRRMGNPSGSVCSKRTRTMLETTAKKPVCRRPKTCINMRKNLYKKLYTKIRHNRKGKVVSKLTVLAHSGRVGPLRVTSRNPNEVTTPNRYLRDFFSSNLAVLWCQTEESKLNYNCPPQAKNLIIYDF